jgi:Ferredoxin-like domain in Api92-like protein
MANIVTNIVLASSQVLRALEGNGEVVDFHSLIPIPPEASGMNSDYTTTSLVDLLTGQINFQPSNWDLVARLQLDFVTKLLADGGIAALATEEFETFLLTLRKKRGGGFVRHPITHPDDWTRENWGTNDNSYNAGNIEGGVQFESAWTPPHPVIERLAARFPDQRIEYRWADEDIGSNCGHRIFESGQMQEVALLDPVDFALTVIGADRQDYRLHSETGKWEACPFD